MFTAQERSLLIVVLCFLGTAATIAYSVFSTLPQKPWGQYANSGPIDAAQGLGKGKEFPRK